MNRIHLLILIIGFVCFFADPSVAQSTNKTIVLVRHAEKDTSDQKNPDPDLSADGRERAVRLAKFVKRYKPHEIFATAYKRTQQTAGPIAAKRKKQIQIYDAGKQNEFVAKIMASKTDHYLIVGHSNTIPPLANLLAKKEIFRNLVDAEHGVIWVIRIRKGVLRKVEIFSY
jgi:broad specificity phosphatase PhoE